MASILCKECGQEVQVFESVDMSPDAVKKRILLTVTDLVGDFVYYDRKEDEGLPRGAIESAILESEDFSLLYEIIQHFAEQLAECCNVDPAAVQPLLMCSCGRAMHSECSVCDVDPDWGDR